MKMVTIAESEREDTLVPCDLIELSPSVGRTFQQMRNVK